MRRGSGKRHRAGPYIRTPDAQMTGLSRMRSPVAVIAAGLLVAYASGPSPRADRPAQARSTTPAIQTVPDPWPDATVLDERRRSAETRPLFASAEPLPITIAADFRAVQRDRNPKSEKTFPATITVPNEDGTIATIPIQIRTRGHSRRLRQTCDFAPLRLEFIKEQARKTVFEGHGPLKLGTHCKANNSRFEQYVLREYTVYRLYNLLTPFSFRARLVRVTYVDTAKKKKKTVDVRYAMFIEDDDDVARRMSGRISDRRGLLFRNVHADTVQLMTLFEYMIGNTDMSMKLQHNVRIVETPANVFYPVPYDFDYSGLVDTSYAVADTKLFGIQTVRERLYRGPCKTAAELEPFFARFRAAKADIMALYTALADMTPSYRKDAQKYLDAFYSTIDQRGAAKAAFIDRCDNRQGM
jgi:hypothetical protein